jgi:Fe-S-cluster-containing dehydrogenase component
MRQELMDFLVDHRFINGEKAMVINLDRCIGCDDCVRACATAHNNNPRFTRQGFSNHNAMVANACMHCTDPVCLIGCPTGAIHREEGSGTVVINDNTCIGCATCANSCPYDNIKMVDIRDKTGAFLLDSEGERISRATKCDLCVDQLTGPACVQACPHDALIRIDIRDSRKLMAWLG